MWQMKVRINTAQMSVTSTNTGNIDQSINHWFIRSKTNKVLQAKLQC